MRLLLAAIIAIGLVSPGFAADTDVPAGRILLTVAGDLPNGNAPASDPDALNFSGYLDLEYDKAMAFDDLMLADLPQHEITATLHSTEKEMTFTGPRLSDLLRASGAEGKTAMPMALDGYQAEISWDSIATHEPILATHADGKPLSIGGWGPVMVVYPVVDDKELYESFDAMQVYSTFFIGVE